MRQLADRYRAALRPLRRLPVLGGKLGVVDLLGEPRGLSFAPVAFGIPLRLFLLLMGGVIGLPFLVGGLVGGPLGAFGVDLAAPRRPIGFRDRLALLALRGCVDRLGPGQETAGYPGLAVEIVRR